MDSTSPTGSIKIDDDASYTNSISVTLSLSAIDSESGVAQMQFSNDDTNWSTAEPYAITKSWTLSTGGGTKTVYVKYKDAAGNWSIAYSDTIILITPAPPVAQFAANPTGGVYPLTVTFANNSIGDITSYSWDFGDGGTSTEVNPGHTYTQAGSYTVTLTATGPGGSNIELKENYIHVTVQNAPSIDSASISPDKVFIPGGATADVQFTASYTNWQDPDGPEIHPLYRWYLNYNAIIGATASTAVLGVSPGDGVHCVIVPYDGIDRGIPVESTHAWIYEGVTVSPQGSIQAAIDTAPEGYTVYILKGKYEENLCINGKNLHLFGEDVDNTIIKGNISLSDSDSAIESLSVLYNRGEYVTYSNPNYTNFKLLTDAGITAINSEIGITSCIIMPNPDVFGTTKFGKGIQVWNLYGSEDIMPLVQNNLILNADTGIYLYSQAFGGAILGEIKNNTLDMNKYGIVLRMHKENPMILRNIITRSTDAVHLIYNSLLTERLFKIGNNCFGLGAFSNERNIWCDTLQAEQLTLPDAHGNMIEDPEYYDPDNLDYMPQNPDCVDTRKGCRLE